MKKLLMLGSSSQSVERLLYAKSLGYYTITTDNLPPEQSPAKQVSDAWWMISTAEVDILEQKCREEGITAIIDGGSDFNREIMMELCRRLGLPCYVTAHALKHERDKSVFKWACREAGALVPEDYYVSPDLTQEELEKIQYPVIVKPVDQTGNRGVAYCYGPDDVRRAYAEVRRVSDNPNTIIEQMIHGPECMAYYAIAGGEVKFVEFAESFCVEGKPKNCYVLTTNQCQMAQRYLKENNEAVMAFLKHIGCREGYAWIQIMQEENGPLYLIEMGYRLSGEKMHMTFPERHGFNAVHWLTNCALGIPNDLSVINRDPPLKQWAMNYLLWTDRAGTIAQVIGLDKLEAYPGLHVSSLAVPGKYVEQYAYPIQLGFSYNTLEELLGMLWYINENVQILDENGENLLFYYTDFEYLKERYRKMENQFDEVSV